MQAHVFYTEKGARDKLIKHLEDGSAKAKFGKMVAAQGGPENFVERWEDYLDIAPAYEVLAPIDGYVQAMDGTALGQIVVDLGGGRQRENDQIDHAVGLSGIVPLGTNLYCGQPMALVHCHNKKLADQAIHAVQLAILLGPTEPVSKPLILERITG